MISSYTISLPEIQQELDKSIFNARFALSSIPKEPSKDPRNEISNLVHGFVTKLAKHVEGMPDEDGLIQSIQPAQENFRSAIRRTAPEFRPFEKKFAQGRTFDGPIFLKNEEGVDVGGDSVVESLSARGGDRKVIYIDEVLDRAQK